MCVEVHVSVCARVAYILCDYVCVCDCVDRV